MRFLPTSDPPLLALSGHSARAFECLLSGGKADMSRTSTRLKGQVKYPVSFALALGLHERSLIDPKLKKLSCCLDAQWDHEGKDKIAN